MLGSSANQRHLGETVAFNVGCIWLVWSWVVCLCFVYNWTDPDPFPSKIGHSTCYARFIDAWAVFSINNNRTIYTCAWAPPRNANKSINKQANESHLHEIWRPKVTTTIFLDFSSEDDLIEHIILLCKLRNTPFGRFLFAYVRFVIFNINGGKSYNN